MTARSTGPRKRRADDPRPTDVPILTINDAAELYRDEWIFMQVMERDEHQHAAAGIVLAHHPKRDGIQQTILDVIKNPPPDARGFITFRGPLFRTNEEWHAYLEREQAARDRGS